MQIDISVATKEEVVALLTRKGIRRLEVHDIMAPIKALRKDEGLNRMVRFDADKLNKFGVFPETTDEVKLTVPGVMPSEFSFILDYPLNRPARVDVSKGPELGFSLADLIKVIKAAYYAIYDLEEGEKNVPGSMTLQDGSILLNRPETNGAFGIWGHEITDLIIEGITIGQLPEGPKTMNVMIGS